MDGCQWLVHVSLPNQTFSCHHLQPPPQMNWVLSSPCFCTCITKTIYCLIYMFLNLIQKITLLIFLLILLAKSDLWGSNIDALDVAWFICFTFNVPFLIRYLFIVSMGSTCFLIFFFLNLWKEAGILFGVAVISIPSHSLWCHVKSSSVIHRSWNHLLSSPELLRAERRT